MNEFEKYKNWFLERKYFVIIFLGVIALIYVGDVFESFTKIKGGFSDKKDTLKVQLINNSNFISNKLDVDTLNIDSEIELYDLLRIFIPSDNYYQDWFVGSDCKSISWITDGQGDMNDIDSTIENDCPFGRIGYCILSYKHESIYYVLKRKKESGKWKIILGGPNAGVARIYIENEDYGRSLEPSLLKKYLPQSCMIKPLTFDKSDSLNYDYIVTDKYLLKVPNRKEIIVYEQYYCGTAGCVITLILELIK